MIPITLKFVTNKLTGKQEPFKFYPTEVGKRLLFFKEGLVPSKGELSALENFLNRKEVQDDLEDFSSPDQKVLVLAFHEKAKEYRLRPHQGGIKFLKID